MLSVLRIHKFPTAFLIIVLICACQGLSAQYYDKVEQTMFNFRINAPIEVEVKKNDSGLLFTAKNSSFYQYELDLEFLSLTNLQPATIHYHKILEPGNNRLFTLKIVDEDAGYNYQYNTRYAMYISGSEADRTFPYLIPLGEGRTVNYFSTEEAGHRTVLLSVYQLNPGDTVCAARKGMVTASPGASIVLDRIGKENSLELRHSDGTIAVYDGIKPDACFARLGHYVYPGEAIGIVEEGGIFKLTVYEFLGEGRIRRLDIAYSNKLNDGLLNEREIQGLEVRYPEEVLLRELSKREKKRLRQGKLF